MMWCSSYLPLRYICEMYLAVNIASYFQNFQDGELLKHVRDACQWADLWTFFKVYLEWVMTPLENARRWGLVCSCCAQLRLDLACPVKRLRNSRRLAEARLFTSNLVSEPNSWSRELTLDLCDGVT